jgi:phage terminase large subunit
MKVDFSRLPELINPKFYPLLWDHKRFNVFYGGAGSGKSVFETQRLTFRMVAEKGHNVLGVRKIDKANRDTTFAQMVQTINAWGLHDIFHITVNPLAITCKHNGNQMLFRGLDDPEKLKSITFANGPLTDIWIEEASEITPTDDRQLRLRLRGYAAVPKQVTYTFNPIDATHWLKGRFFDKPLSLERATVLKTTYKDNAWLAPDDRAELEALKDEDLTYYQIYALGEWGVIGNVVFSNYVIEDFTYDLADFDAVYQGQDYGFNHPFAFELVGLKDGELYIFDEVYKRQRTNTELIEDSRQYFAERKILDQVKSGATTADSAEPDRIKEWNQAGWRTIAAKKGPGSERFGIDFMKHRRMHVHRSRCPGIAAEISIFKYREDKNGNVLEEFVDFKNDGIAAVRYATESIHSPLPSWGVLR